jgi:hypothetical protein
LRIYVIMLGEVAQVVPTGFHATFDDRVDLSPDQSGRELLQASAISYLRPKLRLKNIIVDLKRKLLLLNEVLSLRRF